ncbi:RNA polymerase sigma-70 factor (ECF subfamily) [Sphingobacterium allocomposti]|jgi:RNA polymerase sigma-70 factor (family 1)|uniref:RNA polymerase sigma-70 factor (ECF subfamily) n=1 Tax=Sphingobacterium allocomposti TaxID=415956 RepID=A0A5S5DNF3_9SPHI|nr:RNA polymerase sigma-70 factor (ECF subfamily) [Sphingobacterium composti Yoo et al. 2007 non Ten et al. 2007]
MLLKRKAFDLDTFVQFQSGDEIAFRQIFDYYQPILYRKVLQFCRLGAEAEEVTQEAFVQLFLKRGTIDQPDGIYPFLLLVSKRLSISLFRKHVLQETYKSEVEATWKEEHLQTQQEIAYRELHGLVHETIQQLPPQQQLLYRMHKLENYSYAEIAGQVGLSKNTVRNHLNLACKFVRFRLTKIIGMIVLLGVFQ